VDETPSELFKLYRSSSRKRCEDFAFVLQAVGIRSKVVFMEQEFVLLVDERNAERAFEQLELYLRENQARPRRFDPRQGLHDGLNAASLYGVTILVMDLLQRHRAFGLDWWEAGMSRAGLIRAGEWWRTLTALSLHGDPLHLVGNLVFGLVFGFLTGQLLGWGLAWSGMLLAGALGNALNALIQSPTHASIGASTAVFATLGILAAYSWKQRRHLINRWLPLAGGVALLAFLGMGGGRTDIFAHVAGFAAGCLFGALYGLLEHRLRPLARYQLALGLGAYALFVLAWVRALMAQG